MDLLADVLNQAGLQRRLLTQRTFAAPIALAFPCARSFGFHVVIQGAAYIHTPGATRPLMLNKGDVGFMARGFDHVVSTEEKLPSKIVSMGAEHAHLSVASKPARLSLVSGAYQVWNDPVHPFFAELPPWYVLQSKDLSHFGELHMAIHLLSAEVSKPALGAQSVANALLDVVFTYIIRRIIESQGAKPHSWGHAVNEPQIRAALERMHADCARPWSLDELAKEVGLSRAGFAQKFRSSLGATPFHYLATIRIQKAMDLLSKTDDKMEAVAEAVGYKDAFSFSKAFKKLAGVSPRQFRQTDIAERDSKWRFRA